MTAMAYCQLIPVVGVEPTLLTEHDFESCASANSATPASLQIILEAATGFEPVDKGFADLCLTTWLCRHINIGAEDGIRTRDPHLGKVMFYH